MTWHHCLRKTTPLQHARAVHLLRVAAEAGDLGMLSAVLHPTVQMTIDGGPTAPGPRRVRGRLDVARRMRQVLEQLPAELSEREVNGQSGLVLKREGQVSAVVCVDVRRHRITDVWVVLNPDKLRHWNRAAG